MCVFTLMSYEHLRFNGPLILSELEASAFSKQETLQVGHISSYAKTLAWVKVRRGTLQGMLKAGHDALSVSWPASSGNECFLLLFPRKLSDKKNILKPG